MNTLTENFKSAQAELVMKDEQLRVKEEKFQEVTGELEDAQVDLSGRRKVSFYCCWYFWTIGHLGAPQEKMVAKEEALKKREEELATAKVLTRAWENCFIVV